MKKEMEQRGGSKKESVYDVIKRKKHYLRAKEIMNQKYNSVADLAAVLLKQDERGQRTAEEQAELTEEDRRVELKQMRELVALAEADGVVQLRNEIADMEVLREQTPEGSRSELRRQMNAKKRHLERLEWTVEAMAHAKKFADLPKSKRQQEAEYWKGQPDFASTIGYEKTAARKDWHALAVAARIAGKRAVNGASPPLIDANEQSTEQQTPLPQEDTAHDHQVTGTQEGMRGPQSHASSDGAVTRRNSDQPQEAKFRDGVGATPLEADYIQFLPSFPTRLDPYAKQRVHAPARHWLRHEIKKRSRPVYSAEGVTVRWANIMDAEVAEAWPDVVKHERMGLTRFTHPRRLGTEPINDVSTFKAMQFPKRAPNWDIESGLLEKVQARRAEMEPRAKRLQETSNITAGVGVELELDGANADVASATAHAAQEPSNGTEVAAEPAGESIERHTSLFEKIQQEIIGKVEEQAKAERWNRKADDAARTARQRLQRAVAGNAASTETSQQSSPPT